MLHRVGLAISQLLKPIQTEAALSRPLLNKHGERHSSDPNSNQKKKEEPTGFQRFEKKTATEVSPEIQPPTTPTQPKERSTPGLTTAFLGLLRHLQEKRRSISIGLGLSGYEKGQKSQKKGARVRKGMVVNETAE